MSWWGRGSIYRRGKVWWIKYSWSGRTIRESSCSRNREHAEHLLAQRLQPTPREHHACPNCGTAVVRVLRSA